MYNILINHIKEISDLKLIQNDQQSFQREADSHIKQFIFSEQYKYKKRQNKQYTKATIYRLACYICIAWTIDTRQGVLLMLSCCFWPYHLNVIEDIEAHQTRQRFSSLLLSNFAEPVQIVPSVSCS